ncbi:uncharacterized protein LOC135121328 [Zophobas morio]|uniref:uncharacterized protein LOC135121328 n=1 Tax=Zophobas morio TaxID=2755281 RepID=UPI0030830BF6
MILALIIVILISLSCEQKITYTFPEFPYKESNKNEVMFREVETACERGCVGKSGVSKILCVRQCVSPSCYRDLYQADQLEEGEVDVRLNSFKGCFIQRYNRSRP